MVITVSRTIRSNPSAVWGFYPSRHRGFALSVLRLPIARTVSDKTCPLLTSTDTRVSATIPRHNSRFIFGARRSISSMSVPSKISAIGVNKTGDFDVIEKFELPAPQNAPGNILVKVRVSYLGNAPARAPHGSQTGGLKSVVYACRSITQVSISSTRTTGTYHANLVFRAAA